MDKHVARFIVGLSLLTVCTGIVVIIYTLIENFMFVFVTLCALTAAYFIGYFVEKEDADCKQNETTNETP